MAKARQPITNGLPTTYQRSLIQRVGSRLFAFCWRANTQVRSPVCPTIDTWNSPLQEPNFFSCHKPC